MGQPTDAHHSYLKAVIGLDMTMPAARAAPGSGAVPEALRSLVVDRPRADAGVERIEKDVDARKAMRSFVEGQVKSHVSPPMVPEAAVDAQEQHYLWDKWLKCSFDQVVSKLETMRAGVDGMGTMGPVDAASVRAALARLTRVLEPIGAPVDAEVDKRPDGSVEATVKLAGFVVEDSVVTGACTCEVVLTAKKPFEKDKMEARLNAISVKAPISVRLGPGEMFHLTHAEAKAGAGCETEIEAVGGKEFLKKVEKKFYVELTLSSEEQVEFGIKASMKPDRSWSLEGEVKIPF